MKKRFMAMVMAAVMAVSMAACGGSTANTASSQQETQEEAAEPAAEAQAAEEPAAEAPAAAEPAADAQAAETPAEAEAPAAEADAQAAEGAARTTDGAALRLYVLSGPTGIGALNLWAAADAGETAQPYAVTMTGANDEIVAALSKGEADVAAIATNLASTLYNKTEGKISVLAVNTLGVLRDRKSVV